MAVHEVRVLYGAVGRREYVSFDDGINEWVETVYMRGQCVSLAVALHRRTGWPIVIEGGPWQQEDFDALDENGFVLGEQAQVDDMNLEPVALMRTGFRHAMVLSPDGLVDIHGCAPVALKGWDADRRTAHGAPDCSCPPTCACTTCCLVGHESTYYALVSMETALCLDQPMGKGRKRQAGSALKQNHEAATIAAELVLERLGWTQTQAQENGAKVTLARRPARSKDAAATRSRA